MIYKKDIISGILRIIIKTNSKYIYRLVDKLFIPASHFSVPKDKKISVEFNIQKAAYQGMINKRPYTINFFEKQNQFSSLLNYRILETKIENKTNKVEARIYRYKGIPKESIIESLLMLPLYYLLSNYGYSFLHAAMLIKNKSLFLISGLPSSGKSTVALFLFEKGFGLLTDDRCFIRVKNKQVLSIPLFSKVGILNKHVDRHRRFKKYVLKNDRYRLKSRLSLEHSYMIDAWQDYQHKIIIFPRYTAKSNVSLKKISKPEALHRLLEGSSLLYDEKGLASFCAGNFKTLSDLVSLADNFELAYNDRHLDRIGGVVKNYFNL